MKFASALSTLKTAPEAADDLANQVHNQLRATSCDLALLFGHPQFRDQFAKLAEQVREGTGAKCLVGCTGAGVIGVTQEVENEPAVALLAAQLPGAELTPFHVTQGELEESTGSGFWHFQLEVEPEEHQTFLLFADPFSVRIIGLVKALSDAYPGAPFLGGLASGASRPGESRLVLDDEVFDEGAVGVAVAGAVRLYPIVSQGCKPIGEPLVVTRAEKNVVLEVGGHPPMQVLQQLLPQLPARDQQLARTALVIGHVINEYQEDFHRGDFLVRNLIGRDPQTGALAVGDFVRPGQTVQFHVRDGQTAEEDLNALLEQHRRKLGSTRPLGAVLFTCLGRGERMYGVPHHDIHALHEKFGHIPTAGFFCNGEIGPVGDRSYVHGFTSVIGLFCPADNGTQLPG